MALLAYGLSHHTAPLRMRERVVVAPEKLPATLQSLRQIDGVSEATILSTCNRTEIYCRLDQASAHKVVGWFQDLNKLAAAELDPYQFVHHEDQAVKHLLRVSSGLDSMIVGEPQILGQVKTAFREAVRNGAVGAQFERLFSHAFHVAKQIRTDTELGSSPVSVAYAGVRIARQIFGALNERTALLLGAGETSELVAQHLRAQNIKRLWVANRTMARAERLVRELNAEAIPLAAMHETLPLADIVIASTASQLPILGKGAVEQALKTRKRRPMLLIDLAVPRDIEPQVQRLNDIYLYTIDDLQGVVADNMELREAAAKQAEHIVTDRVGEFMDWLKSLQSVDTIKAYRSQAERMRQEVMEKACSMLHQGKDPHQVLEFLAHTLTNKLTHKTTIKLRELAQQDDAQRLGLAKQLFDLD